MTRTAIIVGAGIGGLATAKGLVDAGWDVTVLEEDPQLREVGAGLALTANGLTALDSLGLGDTVRGVAVQAKPEGTRTSAGGQLQGGAEFDSSAAHGIHRATLHRILSEAASGAEIVTGARVVDVTPGERPTIVTTTDPGTGNEGEKEELSTTEERSADLIIGADGIDSTVRSRLWPKARTDYSGASCWRAVVPKLLTTPTGFVQWLGSGAEFGIVPIDGDRAYWYGAFRARMGRTSKDEQRAALERFDGWDDVVKLHIEATPSADVLRHDLNYLPTSLRTFVDDGVALVGDAAHAMIPTLGQGANATLEDAATLGVLAKRGDVADILETYDRLRRPRAQRFQKLSHRLYRLGGDVKNPVLTAARNGAFNLVPALVAEIAADWLLRWEPPKK